LSNNSIWIANLPAWIGLSFVLPLLAVIGYTRPLIALVLIV
jgi:hypothetical protein